MTIKDIQQALARAGFATGPIDGIWGRATIAAVKAFQKQKGLAVDGIAGPQTVAALGAASPAAPGEAPTTGRTVPLVWLEEAKHLLGLKEGPGAIDNPVILDWAKDLGQGMYKSDDIAWCGLFVGHCIGATLPEEPLPGGLLGARSWERFGHATQPTPGAVIVFWRVSPASGKGHVGFYLGEDDDAYCILGGNQSDRVSVAWVSKARFVASRWPATVAQATTGAVRLANNGQPLSVREA
ncbi:TIGR02594 family protein [Novosphingobium sp. FKTRR1]|uniref:NlpC/P60 family protein n=1 Tax=Novosphingobium sp. FKTRR1 TaxID=2879118 RepID=UPI001CF0A67E|nr:TIGR02594 family protein [Novosphingobium sp. FKTRR1]